MARGSRPLKRRGGTDVAGPDLALVELLERKLLHVWPSVETHMRAGWAIRLAHGYSGRSNSASALTLGARVTPTLLSEIEKIYQEAALTPQFRLSPLASADTANLLTGHGYRLKDEAMTMTARLDHQDTASPPAALRIAASPSAAWLDGVVALNDDPSKRNPSHLEAIVGRLQVPAAFATISHQGEEAGFGLSAIHDGWVEVGSVILAPKVRGKGLGRALVTGVLAWGRENGATQAFLQVDVKNHVAINLYRSLGFEPVYTYTVMRKAA